MRYMAIPHPAPVGRAMPSRHGTVPMPRRTPAGVSAPRMAGGARPPAVESLHAGPALPSLSSHVGVRAPAPNATSAATPMSPDQADEFMRWFHGLRGGGAS